MILFPVVGDEAYYFYWGMHPAGGYYDLPPMIGWWLAPFVKVSLAPLWLRLPGLIAQALIALGIYEFLVGVVIQTRAKLAAMVFFFLPFPFFSILMIPDLPLLFFGFFSSFLFFRAEREQKGSLPLVNYFLSGALWGAAFLSKYFAVLLIPAFGLWFLAQTKRRWVGLLVFVLGAFPFLFQHVYWNSQHCWANFVFNLITRQNVNDGTVFKTFGLYLLYLAILSTPFLWGAFKQKLDLSLVATKREQTQFQELSRFTFLLWIIPVVLFGVSALMSKGQGIHWLFFTLPYFVIWASLRIEDLKKVLRNLMICSGVISVLAITALSAPNLFLAKIFEHRLMFEYKLLTHPNEFVENVLPEISHADLVFTEGYTLSSILNYDFQKYARQNDLTLPSVSVWGEGSRFGRVYDWTTDFKELVGKDFVILTPGSFDAERWSPYFSAIKTVPRDFLGHMMFVTVANGFKPSVYLRNEFIKPLMHFYPEYAPGVCTLRDL